jgi:hypothetical protein
VLHALEVARAVDTGAIAQRVTRATGKADERIAAAVHDARVAAVRAAGI